jgi:hypothetical protein
MKTSMITFQKNGNFPDLKGKKLLILLHSIKKIVHSCYSQYLQYYECKEKESTKKILILIAIRININFIPFCPVKISKN